MIEVLRTHWRLRQILWATSLIELQKRYAGSLLGPIWALAYPLLFLSVYLFVWLVVFPMRFPGLTNVQYVAFVFGGLVPYLFLVETLATTSIALKQNIHLVKNVVMPVELISTRAVIVAGIGHVVGLTLLVALSIWSGSAGPSLLLLPVVVALQVLCLIGIGWILAPIGLLVPDVTYVIALLAMLLMFVSPIAYAPEMVPGAYRIVIGANPVTYMAAAYRGVAIESAPLLQPLLVFAALSSTLFVAGAAACARFKDFVVDFE
jgi:lipopolysaccharide transport system permease protein